MTTDDYEERIRSHGFTLRYVEFCEDAQTPGILGYYRGVTSHTRKEVKVATRWVGEHGNPTLLEVLAHELRHIEEPEWDCGNRAV